MYGGLSDPLQRSDDPANDGTAAGSSSYTKGFFMPTTPARTRVILAELRELCMSPCTMPHADRLAHEEKRGDIIRDIAAGPARDKALEIGRAHV